MTVTADRVTGRVARAAHRTATRRRRRARGPPRAPVNPSTPILPQPLAAPCDHVEELGDLGVDLLDVDRSEAAGGEVAGDRLRTDRHRAHVADVARGFERLPLGVQ